jgi:hypothetical protein
MSSTTLSVYLKAVGALPIKTQPTSALASFYQRVLSSAISNISQGKITQGFVVVVNGSAGQVAGACLGLSPILR